MRTLHLSLLKVFVLLAFTSCDRAEKTPVGTMTFRMPNLAQANSSNKLSGDAPVQLTDINCYGVVVAGPEPALQKNTCFQSANSTSTAIQAGLVRLGVPAGSELSIDVPAGNERVITLVGFKSQSGYCFDWLASNSNIDTYVSPGYILGKVEHVSLAPGEVREIPVTMVFSTAKYVDECSGPDFPQNNNSGAAIQLTVTKPTFPESFFVLDPSSSCQEFNLGLADSNGEPAYLSGAQTFSVSLRAGKSDGSNILNSGDLGIYSSSSACSSALAGTSISNVTLSANQSKMKIYVKGFSAGASYVQVLATTTGLQSANLVLGAQDYSQATFEVSLPNSLVPGGCYAGTVRRAYMSGTSALGSINLVLGSASLQTFSLPNCTSALTTGTSSQLFYFKISPGETSTQTLTVTGTAAVSATKSIKIAPGDLSPTAVRVLGYTNLPSSTNCGPDNIINIALTNSRGSALPVPFGSTLSYTLDFPAAAVLKETNCSGGALPVGSAQVLNAGSTSHPFALVGTGVPVPSGSITITPSLTYYALPASIWNFILW